MWFKTVVLSLYVALAAASCMDDLVSQMPSCARRCLDDDFKMARCDINDHSCHCTKIHGITNGSASCISTACSSDEQKDVTKIITEVCLDVTHEVDPDTLNSALHSLASVAGSAVADLTSATGPAFTSAVGAASDAFTSATAAAGDSFASATAAAGGIYTSASTAVGDVVGGATHGAGSPATSTPAAANQATVGIGIVGAVAMFALAL
ncbi:hypothetical protein F4803DRAFT_547404 [Xylaria telfairii]|nr:hypothetical protein F4803DRAFT_547404 [Xylaria telfairii]